LKCTGPYSEEYRPLDKHRVSVIHGRLGNLLHPKDGLNLDVPGDSWYTETRRFLEQSLEYLQTVNTRRTPFFARDGVDAIEAVARNIQHPWQRIIAGRIIELEEAAAFYDLEGQGLGSTFITDFERAGEQIRLMPESSPMAPGVAAADTLTRNCLARRPPGRAERTTPRGSEIRSRRICKKEQERITAALDMAH